MDTFSWNSKFQYQTEFHGVEYLWNSIAFNGNFFMEFMSQYQIEFQGNFSIEFHGIPWNSMGLFYTG